MSRLLTLRRNLSRLLARDEVDDNFINVASDFTGTADPAALVGAYVQPYMKWADTGSGWLKRRNAANDGWVAEQRLLRQSMPLYQTGELPTTNIGAIYVNGQGAAEWDSVSGSYTPRMLLRSDKGAESGVAPLDAARRVPELNSRYPGVRELPAGSGFNSYLISDDYYIRASGTNAPDGFTGRGLLRVRSYGGLTLQQLVQWNAATWQWWRMQLSSDGTWGPWHRVVAEGDAMRRVRLTTATDANTLIKDNVIYAWSNGNIMGTNFPNIKSAGYLWPIIMASDYVSQELTVLSTGRKPYCFQRTGDPVSGVWQPWRVTSAFSNANSMPDFDAGDIYVDGIGWHRWNGTRYVVAGALGPGQVLTDVTGSRALSVSYVNSTGRPIMVYARAVAKAGGGTGYLSLQIGTPFRLVDIDRVTPSTAAGDWLVVSSLVPPGERYIATSPDAGVALDFWKEYR